jgi:hypothetical protein
MKAVQQCTNFVVFEKVIIKHLCRDLHHKFSSKFISIVSSKAPKIARANFEELAQFTFK